MKRSTTEGGYRAPVLVQEQQLPHIQPEEDACLHARATVEQLPRHHTKPGGIRSSSHVLLLGIATNAAAAADAAVSGGQRHHVVHSASLRSAEASPHLRNQGVIANIQMNSIARECCKGRGLVCCTNPSPFRGKG